MAVPPLSEVNRNLFNKLIDHHIRFSLAKLRSELSKHDWYRATALVVRDMLVEKNARDAPAFRSQQFQEALLPVARISDRPLAGKQSLQPRHHRHLPRFSGRERNRPADPVRRGARRGARQRRPGPAGCMFSRFAGDARFARLRVRHQLRVRAVPPGDSRRLPGRAARRMAARNLAVAGGAPRAVVPDSGLRANRAPHRSTRANTIRSGWIGACWSACRPICRSRDSAGAR